jgi:hypothetical protein
MMDSKEGVSFSKERDFFSKGRDEISTERLSGRQECGSGFRERDFFFPEWRF